MLRFPRLRTLLRSDLMMALTCISLLACITVYFSPWFRIHGLSPTMVLGGFILKCVAGFMLLWLYGHFMEIDRADADVFKYFDDAVVMHSSSSQSIGIYFDMFLGHQTPTTDPYFQDMFHWSRDSYASKFNDNRIMIRFHSLLLFITGGDIRAHQVLFELLSYLGLVFLFKGLQRWAPMSGRAFLAICLLPPSLLFWGSGMLKETLVMLPLGLLVYGIANLSKSKMTGEVAIGFVPWVMIGLGMLLFSGLKPYVGICLLPGIVFLVLKRTFDLSLLKSTLGTVVLFLLVLGLSSLTTSYDVISILAAEQREFVKMATYIGTGSLVQLSAFDDFGSFLLQVPNAIFLTLFRPGVWEIRGALDAVAALENLLYILLIIIALIYRKKELPWVPMIFSFFMIASMSVLIGSLTPVLGAVVRYKVPLLPFLMFAIYQTVDFSRLPLIRSKLI